MTEPLLNACGRAGLSPHSDADSVKSTPTLLPLVVHLFLFLLIMTVPLPAVASECGDGIVDSGEECDDGGTCIGGANAGTPCTAESDCVGAGVCEFGAHIERVCDTDADCPGSRCVHCKTFGGDGCAANCTTETTIDATLVPGRPAVSAAPGTSSITEYTDGVITALPLSISGNMLQIVGKERDGVIPLVGTAAGLRVPSIRVGTVACECIRGVALKTCGGTLFERDGTAATDCTDGFTAGNVVCTSGGRNPCTFVHGPGNASTT